MTIKESDEHETKVKCSKNFSQIFDLNQMVAVLQNFELVGTKNLTLKLHNEYSPLIQQVNFDSQVTVSLHAL